MLASIEALRGQLSAVVDRIDAMQGELRPLRGAGAAPVNGSGEHVERHIAMPPPAPAAADHRGRADPSLSRSSTDQRETRREAEHQGSIRGDGDGRSGPPQQRQAGRAGRGGRPAGNLAVLSRAAVRPAAPRRAGDAACAVRAAATCWLASREQMRIADIILAVDEPIKATRCTPGSPNGCHSHRGRCLTHDLWEELGNQIYLYLSSVTLADVCERRVLGSSRVDVRRRPRGAGGRRRRAEDAAGTDAGPSAVSAERLPGSQRDDAAAPARRSAAMRAAMRRRRQSVVGAPAWPPRPPADRGCARAGRGGWSAPLRPNVVFTSGGTEANALALRGARPATGAGLGGRACVGAAAPSTAREIIPVDGDGVVRLDALEEMLAARDRAGAGLGDARQQRDRRAPAGRRGRGASPAGTARWSIAMPCRRPARSRSMSRLSASHLLSLSAHKLGGPAGVGALVVDPAVPLSPLLRGGGQERGRRAGTENVLGIVGFGAAAAEAADRMRRQRRLAMLRDGLERRLKAICPSARLFGAAARAAAEHQSCWRCRASTARRR